ncbi:MAG: hypothetical protein ABL866_07085 [Devosia sp.]
MRVPFAFLLLVLSATPSLADGWRYEAGSTQSGRTLHVISDGAAIFVCGAGTPLTFGVEISYDLSEISKTHPPAKVAWLVDDQVGEESMWARRGLYVFADAPTSKEVALAAKKARAFVGIKTGNLTSVFDVQDLAKGLSKLEKACP